MANEFAHSDPSLSRWAAQRAQYFDDDGARAVGLFINDYLPVPGVDETDLTECNLADYARQNVAVGVWSQGVVDHVQVLTAPSGVVFTTNDGTGQLCYGYFIWYTAEGSLEWAQRFATPQLLVAGVPISFTPREKLKDCPD
jgi:hypothetical protein